MKTHRAFILVPIVFTVASTVFAQQVPDTGFKPRIDNPAYAEGKGPIVLIDEAHVNFHTAGGRYQTFADLLRRDGYVVKASTEKFTEKSFGMGQILVIANALSETNRNNWSPPNPSAFTDEEVRAVQSWVQNGGCLFLIADHLPFPGAAGKLAAALGITFNNGYAIEPRSQGGPLPFKRSEARLADHPVTRGRNEKERIDTVVTFTGSAFRVEKGAEPVLLFSPDAISVMPAVFGQPFTAETPRAPIGGWYQGAVLKYGKGRLAIFGEAAMFSAQLAGPNRIPMGMNSPAASQNPQFLLNVMHWLSGLIK